MYQAIIVIHVLLGLGIIGLVLMQHGKGADAGAAFGSGASGSLFGAQGATTFLSRTTAIFAVLFFSTSLGLAVYSGHREAIKDFMDQTEQVDSSELPLTDVPDTDEVTVPMTVPSIADQQAAEEIPAIGGEMTEAPDGGAAKQKMLGSEEMDVNKE